MTKEPCGRGWSLPAGTPPRQGGLCGNTAGHAGGHLLLLLLLVRNCLWLTLTSSSVTGCCSRPRPRRAGSAGSHPSWCPARSSGGAQGGEGRFQGLGPSTVSLAQRDPHDQPGASL